MEPGAELFATQETATVSVAKETPVAKKQSTSWWTEENWLSPKKALVNSRYPYFRGQCDEACLALGFEPVPKHTVFSVLHLIVRKPIIYDNDLCMKKRELISEMQVNYVEDIIVKRYTANLGMSRKEVIHVISDLGQSNSFIQE